MYEVVRLSFNWTHLHLWIFVSIPFGILRNTSEIPIILRRKNYPQPHVHWNFGMLTPFISPHFKWNPRMGYVILVSVVRPDRVGPESEVLPTCHLGGKDAPRLWRTCNTRGMVMFVMSLWSTSVDSIPSAIHPSGPGWLVLRSEKEWKRGTGDLVLP